MADSYLKKEREKKRRKKNEAKKERKRNRKEAGVKPVEFMYLDEQGNFTTEEPDPTKKEKINLQDIQISVPKSSPADPTAKKVGTVKFFNSEKAYGFITESSSKRDFYVQSSDLKVPIKENDKVKFDIASGPKGNMAVNVEKA